MLSQLEVFIILNLVNVYYSFQSKDESPVAPDSTTVDRLAFTEGEDVLLHDENGLFIFGTIIEVILT